MSDEQIRSEVSHWLQQTGYVLEMEVARRLLTNPRKGGPYAYIVSQGVSYVDPVEGKVRETDLTWNLGKSASDRHSCRVLFAIECKNSSAPWVVFSGAQSTDVFPIEKEAVADCEICRTLRLPFWLACAAEYPHHFPGDLAYNIVEKRNKDGKDLAREAILSSVSAAIAIVMEKKEEDQHGYLVVVPVVVTTSPLFVAQLDNDGEISVKPVSFHTIAVRNAKRDDPTMVSIVTMNYIDTFIDNMCDMFESCWRQGTEKISQLNDESKQ